MQGLWKDNSKPNHHKGALAKLQILSICCDHFCLSEWKVSETKRQIGMKINILLFLKICWKNSNSFQICQANDAIYVKAYLHLL